MRIYLRFSDPLRCLITQKRQKRSLILAKPVSLVIFAIDMILLKLKRQQDFDFSRQIKYAEALIA